MLKQISRLSLETDGRFATSGELQFLKDYLDRVETRITAYEKIRDREEEILECWETAKHLHPENLFLQNGHDINKTCRRDTRNNLRLSATTMLIADLDRFRDGTLIWYQTIVKSYNYKWYANINYSLIQTVIRQFLTDEEAEMIIPVFQLSHSILAS